MQSRLSDPGSRASTAARYFRAGIVRGAPHALAVLLALTTSLAAADCDKEPRLQAIDFWLGRWIVTAGREFAGHNLIEKMLDGCAVTERWLDAQGHAGFSFFWYDHGADRWKQVWVTDHAASVGGTKEKSEVRAMTTPERIRFEGRYPGGTGGVIIHDRTTLAREASDRVRQLIEISKDGGKTWAPIFDAEYRRAN